jgi:hypothetical protein
MNLYFYLVLLIMQLVADCYNLTSRRINRYNNTQKILIESLDSTHIICQLSLFFVYLTISSQLIMI